MQLSEYKRLVRRRIDPVKPLYQLEKLEQLPAEKVRKTHAIDHRSFVDSKGYWNVYPIGTDEHHVYIVCPYCHEIHCHGNAHGEYEGLRVPHCHDSGPDYRILQAKHRKKSPLPVNPQR